jgi:predicted phosphodiesterase
LDKKQVYLWWCTQKTQNIGTGQIMSRIAVISDIHSNWQALKAVWARIQELGCDQVYCLGDIVGYGARPIECLEHLRKFSVTCVQGNHDALVADGSLQLSFNVFSLAAVEHNRMQLNAEQLEYLNSLPTDLEPEPGIILSHGSPGDRDRYLLHRPDFVLLSEKMKSNDGGGICFFGHTHLPVAFDGHDFIDRSIVKVPINRQEMMLLNPGSVGQPRDRDPRASFLYVDRQDETINFERVEYDVDRTREEILAAGLPERLAARLLEGR